MNMNMAPTREWRTADKDGTLCLALLECTASCPAWGSGEKGADLQPWSTKKKWL